MRTEGGKYKQPQGNAAFFRVLFMIAVYRSVSPNFDAVVRDRVLQSRGPRASGQAGDRRHNIVIGSWVLPMTVNHRA